MEVAERMVACYNACEGINPEAIADMVAVLRELVGVASNQLPERVWNGACVALIKLERSEEIRRLS